LDLAAEPGIHMTVYAAEPGSPSEESLRLLASWAATDTAGEPLASTTPPVD
ncbi:transcriptional regulator, partial [Streptomyces roseolus]